MRSHIVILFLICLIVGSIGFVLSPRPGEAMTATVTGSVQTYTSFSGGDSGYQVGQRCDSPNSFGVTLEGGVERVAVYGAEGQVVGLFTATEPVVVSTSSSSLTCRYAFSGDLPSEEAAWQFVVTDGPELDPGLIPVALRPDEVAALMGTPDGLVLRPSKTVSPSP